MVLGAVVVCGLLLGFVRCFCGGRMAFSKAALRPPTLPPEACQECVQRVRKTWLHFIKANLFVYVVNHFLRILLRQYLFLLFFICLFLLSFYQFFGVFPPALPFGPLPGASLGSLLKSVSSPPNRKPTFKNKNLLSRPKKNQRVRCAPRHR